MIPRLDPYVRFALAAALVAGSLTAVGCSAQPAAKTAASPPAGAAKPAPQPTAAPPSKAAEPAAAPAAAAPASGLEPPDGKWLKDDQGHEYFLSPYPKNQAYRKLDDGRIQVGFGLVLEVAKEDAENFYFKVYKPEPPPPARPEAEKMSAEEKARIAATYKPEVAGTTDRIRFEPFDRGLPTRGQWRNGLAIADIDGDGHPDIVHGPARKGRPVPNLFLGDGKGDWKPWADATFPAFPYDYGDAAVADFNGDGKPDIALAMHIKGLIVMVGDGAGHFTDWSTGIDREIPGRGGGATSFSSRSIVAVDWNHDGRPDIVAIGEGFKGIDMMKRTGMLRMDAASNGLLVYLNNGDGTWTKQRDTDADRSKMFSDSVIVGDFNGDGMLDAVTASAKAGSKEIFNVGRPDGSWKTEDIAEVRPDAVVGSVAGADFDGDGREDLAVGYVTSEQGDWLTGLDVLLRPGGRRLAARRPGGERDDRATSPRSAPATSTATVIPTWWASPAAARPGSSSPTASGSFLRQPAPALDAAAEHQLRRP